MGLELDVTRVRATLAEGALIARALQCTSHRLDGYLGPVSGAMRLESLLLVQYTKGWYRSQRAGCEGFRNKSAEHIKEGVRRKGAGW